MSTRGGERGPIVFRRRLGSTLRTLRDRANIRLSQASAHIECSTSKLSRIESGQGIPRALEVAALLDLYGIVDTEERQRILGWTENAKATAWWEPYSAEVTESLEFYMSLEAEARMIRTFTLGPLSGLLQTPEYATATLAPYVPGDTATLDTRVAIRMGRRRILERRNPVGLELLIAEETLSRPVGSPAVMRGQLESLIAASTTENVEIAILPVRAPRPIANAIFTIFYPRDDADSKVVNEEGNLSTQWFETPSQVTQFEKIWQDLWHSAATGSVAREIIAETILREYP